MSVDRVDESVEDLHPNIPAVVGLPLLLILVVLTVPYGIGALAFQAVAAWRLRRRLSAIGRFRPWVDLLGELKSARGTLIVEQALKRGYRIWWTPECVKELCPTEIEIPDLIDYYSASQSSLFFRWCFENYCSPTTGRAILTYCPIRFPVGFIQRNAFTDDLPEVDVILTLMQSMSSTNQEAVNSVR